MIKGKFSKKHLYAILSVLLLFVPIFYDNPESALIFGGFFVIMGGIIFLALKFVIQPLLAPMLKRHDNFLKANGFIPCTEEEIQKLKEAVNRFKAGLQGCILADAVKTERNGKTVFQYFYSDPLQSHMRVIRHVEMIVPFPRRFSGTAVVVLKRGDGMGKMLQSAAAKLVPAAAKAFSSKDNPLESLKLPPELENGKILWILGPPQREVHDLLTPKEIETILHGADVGVETVVVGDTTALVGFAGGYVTETGYAKLPTYLTELTSR